MMNISFIGTFHQLSEQLKTCQSYSKEYPVPGIWKYNTRIVAPETRLLAALWYLATQDSYRSIGRKYAESISISLSVFMLIAAHVDNNCSTCSFNLDGSTVHDSVSSLCTVLEELSCKYICWPDEDQQDNTAEIFYERTG